jgi:hypothetical protein
MSIGYQAAEQPVYVNAVDFARILPQYIPANKLDRVLQETKGFTRVRLLKAAVNEISLALRPVNTGSIATAFKSESKPTKTMKIEFSANEFKGTFLGENIVDSITVAAIERAWYRLSSVISNTLMPWNYDGGEMTDTDDAAEQITIEGAIDEFAALAKGIYNAMKPLDQATAMGTADDSMKALVARIDEFKLRIAGKEKSEELVSGFKSAREVFDAIEKTINPGPTEDEMKVIGDAELDALENELMLEELY